MAQTSSVLRGVPRDRVLRGRRSAALRRVIR